MSFTPQAALDLISRACDDARLGHAYLITGPAGSGKRALAEAIFLLVNRLPSTDDNTLEAHPDAHPISAESKSRRIVTEQIRELERSLHMKSSRAAKKVGVIFDADRLQPAASNAFLKTLEEPPSDSLLLLLTASPESLLDTILSRCLILPLQPPATVQRSEWEIQLLNLLSLWFADPAPRDLPRIFGLVRDFQEILQRCKETIASEYAAELKAEEKALKGVAEARYLEKIEEQYDALTSARTLRERSGLLELLTTWWADVARQHTASPHLDLPDFAIQTAWLATQEDAIATLERLEALEILKENLNYNLNEPLALESAFLKAFR